MNHMQRLCVGLLAFLLFGPVPARAEAASNESTRELAHELAHESTNTPAEPSLETVQIVDWAREILEQVQALPADKRAQFDALVSDAAGFAIFPRISKRGLILASISGRGVLIYREPDGQWSLPVLLQVRGSSLGPQIGAQTSEVLVVFKTEAALRRLGEPDQIAADGAVSPDETGHSADVVSHQTNRGLVLGQSIDRMRLYLDSDGNAALYGRAIKPGALGSSVRAGLKPPPCIQKLLETANTLQGKPPVSRTW
jgi:lipid-binding SYLF domain-containing protein